MLISSGITLLGVEESLTLHPSIPSAWKREESKSKSKSNMYNMYLVLMVLSNTQ